MRKELIERLISYIPNGDGHNSQYANDLADAVELLEAADALEAKAAPVGEREAFRAAHRELDLSEKPDAWGRPQFLHSHVEVTWRGWQARAALSPAGGGVVQLPERHSRKEAFECGGVAQEQFVKGWNACLDEVARLNGKEVGRG